MSHRRETNRRETADARRDDIAWRASVLAAAGLASPTADAIAARRGIDVHAIVSLVERGCPVHLALRMADDRSERA